MAAQEVTYTSAECREMVAKYRAARAKREARRAAERADPRRLIPR